MKQDNVVIDIENIGKLYRIGETQPQYRTIRESIIKGARAPFRRAASILKGQAYGAANLKQEIWALRNVTFQVNEGEVLGIIGRNGAGKTTLLKILSRITEPTEGRARIYGKVGSLLEVGTGMHLELTGRENIYLNGAILGMRNAEISRKFDEIVEFSGIEKFIDTPMKHYSSGMQVRLAFSVAAHLEPQILLIDEVLAVGDAEFQKKCMNKMNDISKGGRTILFVSHNMGAVKALCPSTILLSDGQVELKSDSETAIRRYLSDFSQGREIAWDRESAPGDDSFRLLTIRVMNKDLQVTNRFLSSEEITIEMDFEIIHLYSSLCIGFDLLSQHGGIVLRSYHNDGHPNDWPSIVEGMNSLRCRLPKALFNAGSYSVCPKVSLHRQNWIINAGPEVWFDVDLAHSESPFWSSLSVGSRPGLISPILEWSSV